MNDAMRNELGVPAVVDRSTFQAEMDALRDREKAHMREGDAIATARRSSYRNLKQKENHNAGYLAQSRSQIVTERYL